MDAARFDELLRVVRDELTAEQCRTLTKTVTSARDDRGLTELVAGKAASLDESRQCPLCGGGDVIKWGRDEAKRQRFRCRNAGCRRYFTALTGTVLSRSRRIEEWVPLVRALVQHRSLRSINEETGIHRTTALDRRHRLLSALMAQAPRELSGIIEADETFFLRSFKGSGAWQDPTKANPVPRMPCYRGSGVRQRGVSPVLWAPVLCALDRTGAALEAVLPDTKQTSLDAVLKGHVQAQSVLCSDGAHAYRKLAQNYGCEHRVIVAPKGGWASNAKGGHARVHGALTLGRVNARHQILKTVINRVFRGVSTARLPNYLTLLRLSPNRERDPMDLLRAVIWGQELSSRTGITP
jgi:transposase-like protein